MVLSAKRRPSAFQLGACQPRGNGTEVVQCTTSGMQCGERWVIEVPAEDRPEKPRH
jgi:hypothetical protein